ncbi:PREDICTED: delta-type opioid receptor, partial [Tinamus guttatus]|uniref:delta-type opioid receptor n=1 Tax=Tinamus guttatus TaxID=94827 RepID=UPI00052F103E
NATSILIAVVITALYAVVCVVGLLGNVLVMYGIVRYTKMKTATNIYIFNLALADALATSTLPFQSAKYLMETWPFGELLCKVVLSIDYYNMFTSIFTLTMMSVDRYIAVCHPVKALDFRTPAKAKIINVCIWVLSSVVGVPIMVMAVTKTKDGMVLCTLQFPDPPVYWDTVTKICVFIFAFMVPILVITNCYGLNKKNPYVVASLHFCIALGYTNSSLNPVLYAFLDENFKRCFREFCLPFRARMDPNGFSRGRSTTREGISTCTPSEALHKPA